MKEVETVILAGGKGLRMGNLTKETQKCMLFYKGKPILAHILDKIDESFGKARVLIALGHQSSVVKDFFGNKYKGLDIFYIEDPRPLETKKRLCLVKNLVSDNFIFLAGDVIADKSQMLKVFERSVAENSVVAVVSGASDHHPALGHPLIEPVGDYVNKIEYPSPKVWPSFSKRDMQIGCFKTTFFNMAEKSDKLFISQVLSQIISEKGFKTVALETYDGAWKHFSEPKDLL